MILVAKTSFHWLKRLQETAPTPRLDLRYLVEGMAAELRGSTPPVRMTWLELSQSALLNHLSSAQVRVLTNTGTAFSTSDGEGAQARAPGVHRTEVTTKRLTDCRALQIGETCFEWLKSVQRNTREPRIGLRYLLEGAVALIDREPELLPRVVGHARQALALHLSQLAEQPIPSIHLEHLT